MVRPVAPFPTYQMVKPYDPDDGLRLDDVELPLFDSMASEVNEISGCTGELFQLDQDKSTKDPLYNEAIREVWRVVKLPVWIAKPEVFPEMRQEGLHVQFENVTGWVTRKHLESSTARPPREGDILRVWDTLYTNKVAAETLDPKSGYYFNISLVLEDGYLFDTSSFVAYKLTMVRRGAFTPERRILNT